MMSSRKENRGSRIPGDGKRYSLRSSQDGVRVLRSMSSGKSEVLTEPVLAPSQRGRKRSSTESSKKDGRSIKSSSPACEGRVGTRGRSKTNTKLPELKHQDRKNNIEESRDIQRDLSRRRKRNTKTKGALKNEYTAILKHIRYLLHRIRYEQNLIDAYSTEGWKGQSLEKLRPEKELERAKAEIMRCKLRIRDTFKNIDSMLSVGKLDESMFDSAGEISIDDIACAKCGSKQETLNNDIILCDGICDRGFHQKCLNPPLRTEDIPPGDEGWLCPGCDCKIDCLDLLNEFQGSELTAEESWEKVFPEAAAVAIGTEKFDESNLPSDDSDDDDYNPDNLNADKRHPDSTKSLSEVDLRRQTDDLGLPSEDSGDNDFDPEGPDPDVDSEKEQSYSDESDFTSDSDDFCAELANASAQDEVAMPEDILIEKEEISAEFLGDMDYTLNEDAGLPAARTRKVERLDYKKLYDEAYGNALSDSSNDEEWTDKVEGERENMDESEEDSDEMPESSVAGEGFEGSLLSSRKNASQKRHFGPAVTQRLHEVFMADPYPSRATKESLAKELGLTFSQVTKWFGSTRHYTRHSASKVAMKRDASLKDAPTPRSKSALTEVCIPSRGTYSNETPGTPLAKAVSPQRIHMGEVSAPFKELTTEASPSTLNYPVMGIAQTEFSDITRNGAAESAQGSGGAWGLSNVASKQSNIVISGTPASSCSQPREAKDKPVHSPNLMDDDARKKAVLRELRKRKLHR